MGFLYTSSTTRHAVKKEKENLPNKTKSHGRQETCTGLKENLERVDVDFGDTAYACGQDIPTPLEIDASSPGEASQICLVFLLSIRRN